MKTENGKRVRYGDRAKEAAKFLGDHIWEKAPDDRLDAPKTDKVVPNEVPCLTAPHTLDELDFILRKLKRRKAPGTDEIPMEMFIEMD